MPSAQKGNRCWDTDTQFDGITGLHLYHLVSFSGSLKEFVGKNS
jgi:hypothetical protein